MGKQCKETLQAYWEAESQSEEKKQIVRIPTTCEIIYFFPSEKI